MKLSKVGHQYKTETDWRHAKGGFLLMWEAYPMYSVRMGGA